MAEVLSQSQIDALLSAALGGGDTADAKPAETKPEEKYLKYDFYSPRKFTKDRLKMIRGIFDNYTRIISARLNGLLHTSCEIEVESVEELRYYEFSNAISETEILTLIDPQIGGDPYDEQPIVVHFSTEIMLSMMDRLMGGAGNINSKISNGYIFTSVELKLYENLVLELISVMASSWETYVDVGFNFKRVETNPTLVQIIGLDEAVVLVGLNIEFPNHTGRMNICLPGMFLVDVFNRIAVLNQVGRGSGEDNSDNIMDIIKDSELEIIAELGRTELKLRDVNYLNVGDVINLSRSVEDPIHLYIGGRPWFSGKVGMFNNNMAIKIGETYQQGRGDS